MGSFTARVAAGPDKVTVMLVGECDLSARDELTAVLLEAVNHAKPVCVDLAEVSFFDSTGVHALVAAHHAAQKRDCRIYVVNAGGTVAALLELTGLDVLLRAPAEDRHHA